MELYETQNNFILIFNDKALLCNRHSGKLQPASADILCHEINPVCLGQVDGFIGKIQFLPESDARVLLIRDSEVIGTMPSGGQVFKITRISILTLSTAEPVDLDIRLCRHHHFGMKRTEKIVHSPDGQKPIMKAFSQIRTAAENVRPKKREVREKEKIERRLHEELVKLFSDSESFYYSWDTDLTRSVQCQHSADYVKGWPLWRRCEPRFFWNQAILKDLLVAADHVDDCWLLPVMHGYVQLTEFFASSGRAAHSNSGSSSSCISLALVSRRSKFRAGTRFRKRGVDEHGHVANFVETEQILVFQHEENPHMVSFVQLRGSVPVFWSQSGIKYRPPPKLDRDDGAHQAALAAHFRAELLRYEQLILVSLVDSAPGRAESVVADAYLRHVLQLNDKRLTFVAFDFHEYCRGMHFENISVLLEGIAVYFRGIQYCWVDGNGLICDQKRFFRINCIDCLDRTNVVQTAFARLIMETQLRKFGLLPPEESLPEAVRQLFQQMWANNGDTISRQYAGTVALKGDYTRTGERTINGLMKDGVNSANRYYLRFKEIYRQAAYDILLDEHNSAELNMLRAAKQVIPDHEEDLASWIQQKEENVKLLVEQCKKLCLNEIEQCIGGWGLISCDETDSNQQSMNTVLLLSSLNYYVIRYEDDFVNPVMCQRIPLQLLDRIELGLEPTVFKASHPCMRIHFKSQAQVYFHSFRVPNRRLFNNVLISVRTPEEAYDSLKAIAESFNIVVSVKERVLSILNVRLGRRKSLRHPDRLTMSLKEDGSSFTATNDVHASLSTDANVDAPAVTTITGALTIDAPATKPLDLAMPHRAATALRQRFTNFRDRVKSVDIKQRFNVGRLGKHDPPQTVTRLEPVSMTSVENKEAEDDEVDVLSCEENEDDEDNSSMASDSDAELLNQVLLRELSKEELDVMTQSNEAAVTTSTTSSSTTGEETLLYSCGIVTSSGSLVDEPLCTEEEESVCTVAACWNPQRRDSVELNRRAERLSRVLSLGEASTDNKKKKKDCAVNCEQEDANKKDDMEDVSPPLLHHKRSTLQSAIMKLSVSDGCLLNSASSASTSGRALDELHLLNDAATTTTTKSTSTQIALPTIFLPSVKVANVRQSERLQHLQLAAKNAIEQSSGRQLKYDCYVTNVVLF